MYGLEQGAGDEELRGEDALLQLLLGGGTGGLLHLDVDELLRVVPLVEGAVGIEPLVALKADELGLEDVGEGFGHLGLSHSGFSLEEDGLLKRKRKVEGGGQRPVGDVSLFLESLLNLLYGI